MSTNKQFAYGHGDDGQTDSYLESLAGKRVDTSYQQQMDTVNNDGATAPPTWYSNENAPQYRNNISRVFVIVISVILLLAGIGVCIFGRIQKDQKVLQICPHCDDLVIALYIFGGALILFALLGLGSAITRFKPLAFLYACLVFLLCLACLAAGFAVVVFETGLKESELETIWSDAVKNKDAFICDVQDRLQCSGFDKCCGTSSEVQPGDTLVLNGTWSTCGLNAADFASYCDSACEKTNNQYTAPCHTFVENEVKSHFKPLIGVTFGLAVVLLITGIAAIRMTLRSQAPQRHF